MEKKDLFWCFLVLSLVFNNQVNCLKCYSCTGCSPRVNGVELDCQSPEIQCYIGQLSNGNVNQGCIASNVGGIINNYRSFIFCGSNLCNANNFGPINEGTFFSRSNSKKLLSFKLLQLFFLSIAIKSIF